VGCRRLTPGDGYLEALQEKDARCECDHILRITETGIEISKGVEEFDLIVCTTSFDVSFKLHWNMVGLNGKSLEKDWAENPAAYLSICAEDMPNYFIFNGPNCPVGRGALLAIMEWTAEYILKWWKKIATEDIR
jgi:cation diffusion facilitator CzcD-associated flavoprotein CzcO